MTAPMRVPAAIPSLTDRWAGSQPKGQQDGAGALAPPSRVPSRPPRPRSMALKMSSLLNLRSSGP